MAQKLGERIHFTTVSKLETGKMQFSLEWADAFASVLEVPTSTFFMHYDLLNLPKRIPVYIGLEFVRDRSNVAPNSYATYLTKREDLFGIFVTNIQDTVSDGGVGTVIVDPTRTSLREGGVYVVANDDDRELIVGLYRETLGIPRIVSWPSTRTELFYIPEDDVEVFGEVVEFQRTLVSRNS
jgi:hypothetical protein